MILALDDGLRVQIILGLLFLLSFQSEGRKYRQFMVSTDIFSYFLGLSHKFDAWNFSYTDASTILFLLSCRKKRRLFH